MSLIVAISTVADGSMYNRHNATDASVIANREDFLKAHHIRLEQTSRVRVNYDRSNFCEYIQVGESYKGKGMRDENVETADALVTTDLNHALFLPVADCVGATIHDPIKKVLALAHLGRHSLEQNGAENIVKYFEKNYGSVAKDIHIWLTPAPSKEVYPIWKLDNKGVKEATFEQLKRAGILDEHITDNPAETDKDTNYFSYSEFLKGNRDKDGDHAMVAMMTN